MNRLPKESKTASGSQQAPAGPARKRGWDVQVTPPSKVVAEESPAGLRVSSLEAMNRLFGFRGLMAMVGSGWLPGGGAMSPLGPRTTPTAGMVRSSSTSTWGRKDAHGGRKERDSEGRRRRRDLFMGAILRVGESRE